jgi:hypothetical protein
MAPRIKTIFVFTVFLCVAAFLRPLMLHSEGFTGQTQKVFPVHAGGTLILAVDGPVTVVPGDGQTVIVQLNSAVTAATADEAREILNDLKIETSQEADAIHYQVTSRCGLLAARHQLSSWCRAHHYVDYMPNLQVDYIIALPRRFNLDLTTGGGNMRIGDIDGWLRVLDVGGRLQIGNIGGSVYALTGGGSIDLASARGNADLRTGGGSIHCGYVNGDARLYTRGGAISLAWARGNVEAQTAGSAVAIEAVGSIGATIAGQPKSNSYFKTATGAITIELSPQIKATIDAYGSRYSGRIDSDFPLTMEISAGEELKGQINGGGPAIVISDGSGTVHIHRSAL